MKDFNQLMISPALLKTLAAMEYTTPTPIQAKAIPLALAGADIMGSAQTGTGKTAAFAIPLVEFLHKSSRGSALVLTPTRELSKQVMKTIQALLGPESSIDTAFIIGGEPMSKQLAQLKKRPRVIVGTPGRINDHLERGSLLLNETKFLVLDETDRMLDMGFSIQLDRIVKYLPIRRQTLMFSATLPANIIKLSQKYLNNPQRIAIGSTTNPAKNIKQEIIKLKDHAKYQELTTQLQKRAGSVVLFVKTKWSTEKLAKRLKEDGFKACAIHGDLRQRRRDRVLQDFRQKRFRILVATDVAARGLDIPHIEHVINHDLPQVPEDYIHRIGRTARAGASGEALCLLSPADESKWRAIQRLIDPEKKQHHGKSSTKGASAKPSRKPKHKKFGQAAKRPNNKIRHLRHNKPKAKRASA